MNDQLDLFGTPDNPANELEARFWRYHADNPQVYALFDKFTRYAIKHGRTRLSAKMLFERIRWETTFAAQGGDGFKINNNMSAYYARLWIRNNPRHSDFFATRELRAGPVSDKLTTEAA